ncbi:hypothetical protein J3458_003696 [Metarhizium acridum]|uniref:uncharacterized protein n=1 Tax=Metarhizium acridum TaxID=92637 RepID=UPI001C6C224B|nr:hypothetical protein J3458_003696 [Metarhizium acridum]
MQTETTEMYETVGTGLGSLDGIVEDVLSTPILAKEMFKEMTQAPEVSSFRMKRLGSSPMLPCCSLVLGVILSVILIIDATKHVWEAVENESGLPANFNKLATKLPRILKLLEDAERYIDNTIDESVQSAFTPTLEDCKD